MGGADAPSPASLVSALPTLFITVLVARQLGVVLLTREQGLRREKVLATTGTRFLGVTDPEAIGVIAWTAIAEICAATPGLRLLSVVRDEAFLRVERVAGDFRTIPVTFPVSIITPAAAKGSSPGMDPGPLNAAVGAPIEWALVSLSGLKDEGWLLVGAPKKTLPDVLVSIQGLVGQVELSIRNSEVHQQLSVQARIDALTGLDNRASFIDRLTTGLSHGGSAGPHVLFLDIDDFKDVNDLLGHRAGDAVLVEVAERLRRCIRPADTCARLGGDEFAVILQTGTESVAQEVAQRMVDALSTPILLGGRTVRVGASVGIVTAGPGIPMEKLIHQADVAMYTAKAKGKGRVQVFQPTLLHPDTGQVTLEGELTVAAAAGELVVHYQPIVALPSLRCTGFEALVRWQHPERGLLPPGDFIEIAEQTGAIIEIGTFVLRQACTDARIWQEAHPGTRLDLHVNVSSRELDHDEFVQTVAACLTETGMQASDLVLELTETVVLDSPAAIDRLTALSDLGVRIAIDDFGTGYASVATLRSVPVDIIKLDMSLVAGTRTNPLDRALVRAIVQLSTELDLHTIGEGIEQAEEQDFLSQIGTDAGQGYFYSRPLAATHLTAWLEDNLTATAPMNTVPPTGWHQPRGPVLVRELP